jgi:hypothetical protein
VSIAFVGGWVFHGRYFPTLAAITASAHVDIKERVSALCWLLKSPVTWLIVPAFAESPAAGPGDGCEARDRRRVGTISSPRLRPSPRGSRLGYLQLSQANPKPSPKRGVLSGPGSVADFCRPRRWWHSRRKDKRDGQCTSLIMIGIGGRKNRKVLPARRLRSRGPYQFAIGPSWTTVG